MFIHMPIHKYMICKCKQRCDNLCLITTNVSNNNHKGDIINVMRTIKEVRRSNNSNINNKNMYYSLHLSLLMFIILLILNTYNAIWSFLGRINHID